jgi:hypothetical protein
MVGRGAVADSLGQIRSGGLPEQSAVAANKQTN